VLARANRITSGDDYKVTVRRGRRIVGDHTVMYIRTSPDVMAARFGFIVAKNVGVAVERNRVRRRLKAASSQVVKQIPPGTDVVVRALPGSAEAGWSSLQAEITNGVAKAVHGR
jgi:ribonuclease P protein component